ncbi:MAG: hypothetical protein ACXVNM_07210 [Bacteroidia bacterium]
MRKIVIIFAAMVALTCSYCTKDIVATDLKKKTINILAPGNGIHTPYNTVTFWWDDVSGADKYQIQIVSPSFANTIKVIADSSVTTSKLTLTLNPGTYEWRVRATNNSGSTPYATRSFVIDTSNNLATVTVALLSPADSAFSNKTAQTFSWSSVPAATQYDFSLLDNTGATLTSTTTAGTTFSCTISQTANTNAHYKWKVRATNSFSNSSYTTRALFINLLTPSQPIATHPLNTGTVTIPTVTVGDSLAWSVASSGYSDSLFVFAFANYTDTTLSNPTPVLKTSPTKSYYKITTSDTLGWLTRNTKFFWRLNRSDKAGNSSAYTYYRIFKR